MSTSGRENSAPIAEEAMYAFISRTSRTASNQRKRGASRAMKRLMSMK